VGKQPRVLIAGTGSGVGKTTVTIGIMSALKRRGCTVQGFKCGPDYIDPTYHTAVTGRVSRNLDTWLAGEDGMREAFVRGSEGADISVIEGVMGMYDGKDPTSDQGSSSDISDLLEAPVLLVVDVSGMARSAAAIVLGYQRLSSRSRIAGVIANRCGSQGHYELVKAAVEAECGVPVVGWLSEDETLSTPERHLGLVPAVERGELAPWFERAADRIEAGIDMEALLRVARSVSSIGALPRNGDGLYAATGGKERPVVAIARDAAFHFYYPENLELLESLGARLVPFRPLRGEGLPPEVDGLYLGGGFPEEFAGQLAGNALLREQLQTRVPQGLPVVAECGGYMYLCRSITDRSGIMHPMAGIIPADVRMQTRLAAIGYREVTALRDNLLLAPGETIRGHEFHYSTVTAEEGFPHLYTVTGSRGTGTDGYAAHRVSAGYTHLYFPSQPAAAMRWVEACRAYREERRVRLIQ
jgi:cobyrinic acid a,c-diamide synthase